MQKTLTLLTAMLCFAVLKAQNTPDFKDPFIKTFVQDTKAQPNQILQDGMRDQAAWVNFRQAHGDWWVQFNEQTGTPHRAFGTPVPASGATPEEMAYNFFMNELKAFGSNEVEIDIRGNNTSKYHYVTYAQEFNGLEVLWSEATFRVSHDGNIVMFGLDIYPDITLSTTPGMSAEAAHSFATDGINITVNGVEGGELKILPIPGDEKLEYKLVYEVYVHTMNAENIPGNYYTLVDANNGKVYYRQNEVKECGAYILGANIQTNSDIQDNPLVPVENRGLPYIRVEIDGDNYYADANGLLSLNTINDPTPAKIRLRGLYAKVSEGNGDAGTNIDSIDVIILPGDNTILFDDESGALTSEVSAYYWQNIVHDHMKFYFPSFTDLDIAQLIRVERTDGECNAFYDGNSTNFYEAGGGCPSTALFNDVVMHEYGHGVNYDLYADLGDPGGMGNGALHEGYADLWGITVTDNPIMGQGFFGGAGSSVRRYDLEPKVYPDDLIGEVHADGEIIAGAWWDVKENFGDMVEMTELWMETHNATCDGPSGEEGTLFTDILIEALLADDDNADLADGTPRFEEITSAFCEHGISMIGQVSVEDEGVFTYITPDAPIEILVDLEIDYPTSIGESEMFYRINNSPTWSSVPFVNVAGLTFKSDIPAQSPGTAIAYYVELSDAGTCGNIVLPAEANTADPNLPFFALVGVELQFTEDFDNEFGSWIIDPFEDDNATTGIWDVNSPTETIDATLYQVQGDQDHTPGSGNLCAFTEGGGDPYDVGSHDVDGGKTTIRSEEFDLTMYEDPILVYWRKYSNDSPTSANPGNDVWRVYISDNGVDYVNVESTYTADNTWRRNAIRVKDYVETTAEVSFIFIAQDSIMPGEDLDGGSLVEAQVDDVEIWDAKTIIDTSENYIDDSNLITGVFPNPASDYVSIYFSGDVSGNVTIDFINQIGEIVISDQWQITSGKTYTFETAHLPEGIYLLNCKTENGIANKRVIIQHE